MILDTESLTVKTVPPELALPMIQLHLHHRYVQLSSRQQSLAKAAASRHAMRLHLQTQLANHLGSYTTLDPIPLHPTTLRCMTMKYSEQLVFHPIQELHQWFNYSSGVFLAPGYPPLFYGRTEYRAVSPNKSAVAAIGEGVAGLVAQRLYQCRKLARPNHDFPDIVMTSNGVTYLVEAKATTDSASAIQQVVDEELLRMAGYASACAELDSRPVVGLLVGTVLVNEQEYRCYVSEVRL